MHINIAFSSTQRFPKRNLSLHIADQNVVRISRFVFGCNILRETLSLSLGDPNGIW
jgi:hypothetical protein